MQKHVIIPLILFFHFATAQTYNPNPQTWTISAETVTCPSSANECLLYKSSGKKDYEILIEPIEGFDYQKGNIYTIIVQQEIKQPPIAVGESVFKYTLVKIVSQKAVNASYESSASSLSPQKIFEINFETVPCEADYSKTCLLAKEKGKPEYEILNAIIFGFNFEPGYSYIISVKPTTNGNYYLINEISKTFVKSASAKYIPLEDKPTTENTSTTVTATGKVIGKTNIQSSSTLDKKWYLRKMKESEGHSIVTDDNVMWIEIKTFSDHLDGYGACNSFEAVVKSDLNTTFQISKLTTRYATCGNKKIEDLFYELLQKADRFEIKNNHLILSQQWNYLLDFVSDPNNKEEISSTYTPPTIIKTENKVYATNEMLNQNTSNDISVPADPNDSIEIFKQKIEKLKKEADEKELREEQIKKEQLAQQQKQRELELQQAAAKQKEEEAQRLKAEQERQQKQKELDDLRRQVAEKEMELKGVPSTTAVKPVLAPSASSRSLISPSPKTPPGTIKTNDVFNSDIPATYVGIDFSHAKYYGSLGIVQNTDLASMLKAINYVIPNEYDKYNISKAIKKDNLSIKLDLTDKLNKDISENDFVTYNSAGTATTRFNEDSIADIVGHYNMAGYKSGLAMAFIVDNMDKNSDQAIVWVTFFDIASTKVIVTEKLSGKAAGFGFRNFWVKPFNEIINDIKSIEFKKWALKYASGESTIAKSFSSGSGASLSGNADVNGIPDPDMENTVYMYNGSALQSLEKVDAMLKGTEKVKSLEINGDESGVQLNIKKQPVFVIKMSSGIPDDYLKLYVCGFKKDKRLVELAPNSNTLPFTYIKVRTGIYQIVIPNNIKIGEYAFIANNSLKYTASNSSTVKITCFGITQ